MLDEGKKQKRSEKQKSKSIFPIRTKFPTPIDSIEHAANLTIIINMVKANQIRVQLTQ